MKFLLPIVVFILASFGFAFYITFVIFDALVRFLYFIRYFILIFGLYFGFCWLYINK